MKYGVKPKTYSRYIQEFGSYGEARVFALKRRQVWNNATMQIYEIDGLQEDLLVEQFSPTKGTNYNKITTMKKLTKEEQAFDKQFNDPMEAIEQLLDEAKRLKEKYSDKESK